MLRVPDLIALGLVFLAIRWRTSTVAAIKQMRVEAAEQSADLRSRMPF